MKATSIHLGYEVVSALSINIPLKHMAVTGQTQESGKTTTLEALITRDPSLRAVAFVTKRGERGFESGRQLLPYFEDRADWEFVQSILEATMSQRMKFERAWIVRACKGAKTLADVQRNVLELMGKSKRGMDADMYMLLNEYLEKVIPQLSLLPRTSSVNLKPGLNVVSLVDYPEELQMLVIGAMVRWVHRKEEGVVTLIPEAWKFVPQGKNTPVRLEVEKLAREGAGLKNYIWIDSQDMAGVEKLVLRAAAVWLIGVQREANEVERALGNIPKGIKRPKEADIAKLKLGEFYACWGDNIHKVYVQPAWMDDKTATLIAEGKITPPAKPQSPNLNAGDEMYKEQYEQEKASRLLLEQQVRDLTDQITAMRNGVAIAAGTASIKPAQPVASVAAPKSAAVRDVEAGLLMASVSGMDADVVEQLYQAIKQRLAMECPPLLEVTKLRPEIEVTVQREKIAMNSTTTIGRVAALVAEGFYDTRKGNKDTLEELAARGWPDIAPNVSKAFSKLMQMGFLRQLVNGQYQSVDGMKVNVVEAA